MPERPVGGLPGDLETGGVCTLEGHHLPAAHGGVVAAALGLGVVPAAGPLLCLTDESQGAHQRPA